MNDRKTFWHSLLEARFTRRSAVRAAVLSTVALPVLRSQAVAQTTPAAPATPEVTRVAADYLLHLQQLPQATIATDVLARKGNLKAWPALQGVSIAEVEVPVGGWRAPHLHTNTPEVAVVLKGKARAGLQNLQKEWMEVDLQEGDCVYFPLGWAHWLRNTGDTVLQAYFNYGHELPATVEIPS